jgi:hypothetical protein
VRPVDRSMPRTMGTGSCGAPGASCRPRGPLVPRALVVLAARPGAPAPRRPRRAAIRATTTENQPVTRAARGGRHERHPQCSGWPEEWAGSSRRSSSATSITCR